MRGSSEITVYRVENDEGRGPYTEENCLLILQCDVGTTSTPSPMEDGIPIHVFTPKPHYRFGFSTLVAVCKWFTQKQLKALHAQGFRLAKYTAHHVLEGRKQVAFNRDTATLEGRDSLPL